MSNVKIYKHPTKGQESVKIGFSWPAFLFSIIWMLIKRLWGIAAIWVLCVFIWSGLVMFMTYPEFEAYQERAKQAQSGVPVTAVGQPRPGSDLVTVGVWLALMLVPGFKGNAWKERNLIKRGYKEQVQVSQQPTEQRYCQYCGAGYSIDDYSEDTDIWLCSGCRKPLPRNLGKTGNTA